MAYAEKNRDVISPPTSPVSSARSARSADVDVEQSFKVVETPQQTSTVKLWQLVLFSLCLCMLTLSTAGVIVESVTGLLSGRQMDETQAVWSLPTDIDCKVGNWQLSEEWSDVKLDVCCGTARIGCRRSPSYHCDVVTSDPRELPFSMLRWCCAFEKAHCDALASALEVLVQAKVQPFPCHGPSCPDQRTYHCQTDAHRWWLEWSVEKIERCCQQTGADCNSPVPQKEFHEFHKFHDHDFRAKEAPQQVSRQSEKEESDENEDFYGCSAICTFEGRERSCKVLVNEIAKNVYGHQSEPCMNAKQKTLVSCPQCSDCINQQSDICRKAGAPMLS